MPRKKPGNIYEIDLGEFKRYFQYICSDKNTLDGDVIRCFKLKSTNGLAPDKLFELYDSGILFVGLTVISVGITMKDWKLVGNLSFEDGFELPTLRHTNDHASEVKVSDKWMIWKPNGVEKEIGRLPKEMANYPIAVVKLSPVIKEWAKTGIDKFKYPS